MLLNGVRRGKACSVRRARRVFRLVQITATSGQLTSQPVQWKPHHCFEFWKCTLSCDILVLVAVPSVFAYGTSWLCAPASHSALAISVLLKFRCASEIREHEMSHSVSLSIHVAPAISGTCQGYLIRSSVLQHIDSHHTVHCRTQCSCKMRILHCPHRSGWHVCFSQNGDSQ